MIDPERTQFGQVLPLFPEPDPLPMVPLRSLETPAEVRRAFKALLYALPHDDFVGLVQEELRKCFTDGVPASGVQE